MAKMMESSNWVKQAWMVDPEQVDKFAQAMQYASRADYAFSDTGPGGSPCLNPPPQSCANADLRTGLAATTSLKIGRAYYEKIESSNQYIHIRAGVSRFNSLATFYTSAYDSEAAQLANTGRVRNMLLGFISNAASLVIGLAVWPLMLAAFVVKVARRMSLRPRTKYAYLHPTMVNTWRRTEIIATQLGINDGFFPIAFSKETESMFDGVVTYSDSDRAHLHRLFPNLFGKNGKLDIYSTFTRWYRNNNARLKKAENTVETVSRIFLSLIAPPYRSYEIGSAAYNAADKYLKEPIQTPPATTLEAYQNKWTSIPFNKPVGNSAKTGGTLEGSGGVSPASQMAEDVIKQPNKKEDGEEKTKSWWEKFTEFFAAELDDGGAFMTFKVNETGPSVMSLNNQLGESEVKQKFDSITDSARNSIFSFAGGNVGDGIVASALEAVFNGAKTVGAELGSAIGMDVVGALMGGANIDFPQRYVSSQSNLPTMTYTIELNATYNNPYCRFVQIWLPLAALIALTHPQQTGAQSFTSPPVLEIYDRGHAQSRYAMATSVSISCGEGNQGFNIDWKPSSAKVSITFTDLSTIIYAPISQGFSLDPLSIIFDEDTSFTDYLACISGLELTKQIYYSQKIKRRFTEKLNRVSNFFTPAQFGMMAADTMRVFDIFLPGIQLK